MARLSVKTLLLYALREDAAFRDVTTSRLVRHRSVARAFFLAKEDLVLCGMPFVKQAFSLLGKPRLRWKLHFDEGSAVKSGAIFAEASGPTRLLLAGERVALNLLQRLCGIATLTRRFVEQVRHSRVKIFDTRKTAPLFRIFERYAVKTGGGFNHRFDLSAAVLVKDNHIAEVGSVAAALKRLGRFKDRVPVIVEVKNLEELQQALANRARHVLLDNMAPQDIRRAVQTVKKGVILEASGGITLKNVRRFAETGVSRLSIGALTHSAPAVDISMELTAAR